MKRKIYPTSTFDRFGFWWGIFGSLISFIALVLTILSYIFLSVPIDKGLFFISLFTYILSWVTLGIIYLSQDNTSQSESNEYTSVISDIKNMGVRLSQLNKFLTREQKRVADTEASIMRLQNEQTILEPIVLSQRQTVEAVLAAYTKRTASNIWKERIISFILGIVTSLLASIIYSLINHY